MALAKVTSNGEIPIPPELLEALGIQPGDQVEVQLDRDGTVRIFPKPLAPSEVCGMLASRTHVRSTIEEMDEAVGDAFRRGDL